MAKHHLYDESPRIEHDEHNATKVVKPSKKEIGPSPTEKGVKYEGFSYSEGEGMPAYVRHAMERHSMHSRHEHEHSLHDYHHPGVSKKVMHERHEKEFKDMHSRHEKEAGADGHHENGAEAGAGGAAGKRSGGGEPIEKVEEKKKG